MKSLAISSIRRAGLLALLSVFAAGAAYGQSAKLQIDNLDKLASKATETADINIDGPMLKLAASFLSGERSTDEAKIKEMVAGLQGVYVRRFEFDKESQYFDSDLASIRSQLRAPGWSRLLGIRSKREGQNVEVYTMSESGKMIGLAIISAEPKELTIINIVGPVDLHKLAELANRLGVPRLDMEKSNKPKKE